MPSQIPLVDIITRLDTYSDLHSKGSSSLKSCIWNISIARRQKGLYSCSAADVREELRAHAILEYDNYPELSYEDIVEEPNEEKNIQEHFVLNFGGIPEKQEMVRKNTDSESSNGFGLRQRKGKESPKIIKSEWTESAFEDEQEEILRKVDPLGEGATCIMDISFLSNFFVLSSSI
jgi:hypothetical protein